MPHFQIQTNLPRSKIPQDFVYKSVPILAKILDKPVELCVVSVVPDLIMSFAGTTEPFAISSLLSIGHLGVEENKKHSKALSELVEKELGIPANRMYIQFQDEKKANVGYQGTTFETIWK
ncbi:macrophage migration inhibitory factor-like [Choristoneura fumiferana]|uniref:macrophage migration inhibitory factor-like n=1 Tax=Choristoneura fumiferana TaxID=7141 RepID=UPI003D15C657